MNATIVAQATAVGAAGVAVVRISGPAVPKIMAALNLKLKPRFAHYAKLYSETKELIDAGIWLYFQGPNSFTGEDVLEFQGHGSQWVVGAVIDRFCQLGCRLAEPGEFSRRAFINDKIDLLQAEAVADLVAANSAVAAKMALASLSGKFSEKISALVKNVIECRVQLEAAMDFPEEDFDAANKAAIGVRLVDLTAQITTVLQAAQRGAVMQSGIDVALIGPPNVGKSSLFNALLGHEEAIVTAQAGTTRDILKQSCRVGSVTITLQDTAGLHTGADLIEQEGIRRAQALMQQVKIILLVLDNRYLSMGHAAFLAEQELPQDKLVIPVWNKVDLMQDPLQLSGLKLSVTEDLGFAELFAALEGASAKLSGGEEHGFIARARHVAALQSAIELFSSATLALADDAWELAAEDLRLVQQELSSITGEFSNEDLLSEIFSTFCIGK